MTNIMVDLETLGQTPGCAIISIGAVVFDPSGEGSLGSEFYQVINAKSCEEAGLGVDASTLAWWGKQSEEARIVLKHSMGKVNVPLKEALERFNSFVASQGNFNSLCVWGNGASFDNALLACAYKAVGLISAWPYWNDRCYRTLKNFAPSVKLERTGTHHNALDDAKTQAVHAIHILKTIGLGVPG